MHSGAKHVQAVPPCGACSRRPAVSIRDWISSNVPWNCIETVQILGRGECGLEGRRVQCEVYFLVNSRYEPVHRIRDVAAVGLWR